MKQYVKMFEDQNYWDAYQVSSGEDPMDIEPISQVAKSRTGTLVDVTYDEIVQRLGEPNDTNLDDPNKVTASWGFKDKYNNKAFIWCMRQDPHTCTSWSIDGNKDLLGNLFGNYRVQ